MKKRPYADPTAKRRNIHLSDDVWQALKVIGNGNRSEGIRRLVSEHANNSAESAEPVAYAIESDGVVQNIGVDKKSVEIVASYVYGGALPVRALVFGDEANKQSYDR